MKPPRLNTARAKQVLNRAITDAQNEIWNAPLPEQLVLRDLLSNLRKLVLEYL